MEIIRITYPELNQEKSLKPMSLAVGYFDGVHQGHQQVINTAKNFAEERGLKSAIMTFDPHPMTVLTGKKLENHLITSLDEKLSMFESLAVDYVFIVTFNKSLSQLSPTEFVKQFFINQNVKHVVAGFDFSFGHKGSGKIQNMDEYSNGQLTFTVVDKVTYENEKISSTRIRKTILEGEMELCAQLLGRPFSIKGKVVEGFKRGREIGYPTANIQIDEEHIIPKVGIYAVTIDVKGETFFGMASIGYNPTFTDHLKHPVLEVHIFDFNEEIYGEIVNVYFYRYIRDEIKFEQVDQLIDQMKDDEKEVKNFLSNSVK